MPSADDHDEEEWPKTWQIVVCCCLFYSKQFQLGLLLWHSKVWGKQSFNRRFNFNFSNVKPCSVTESRRTFLSLPLCSSLIEPGKRGKKVQENTIIHILSLRGEEPATPPPVLILPSRSFLLLNYFVALHHNLIISIRLHLHSGNVFHYVVVHTTWITLDLSNVLRILLIVYGLMVYGLMVYGLSSYIRTCLKRTHRIRTHHIRTHRVRTHRIKTHRILKLLDIVFTWSRNDPPLPPE